MERLPEGLDPKLVVLVLAFAARGQVQNEAAQTVLLFVVFFLAMYTQEMELLLEAQSLLAAQSLPEVRHDKQMQRVPLSFRRSPSQLARRCALLAAVALTVVLAIHNWTQRLLPWAQPARDES
jgi:hypothetical protein